MLKRGLPALAAGLAVVVTACTSANDQSPTLASASPTLAAENTENADREVTFCADWEDGETRELELTKGRRRVESGVITLNGESTTPVHVEVHQRASGFKMDWTLRSDGIEIESFSSQLPDNVEEQVADLVQDTTVSVRTDECGIYLGIVNLDELREASLALIDTLVRFLPENELDGIDREEFEEAMRDLTTSDTFLEATYGKYMIYLEAYGWSLFVGESIGYEDEFPNPLGGPPFPAEVVFTLSEFDEASDCGTIEREVFFFEIERVLAETLAMFPNGDSEEVPEFEIKDQAWFEFCEDSSWLTSFRHERYMAVGPGEQTDWIEFRDLPD